jgi:EmrB/QacA subfamily drug resistance transporter
MNAMTSPPAVSRRAWISLTVICLGFLMTTLDTTIVNVALPDVQSDLGFSQADLTWVVNAYLVTYGGFLLVAGRLGDLIGRRRVFHAGIVLFTLASGACGLADSTTLLVAARFVQGIGAAFASSSTIALIVTEFPPGPHRAKAMSMYMLVGVGGASLGLLAGGVLTQALDWHWIFYLNLPIGLATLLLGRVYIDESETIGLKGGVDVLGAVLVTVALMLGVYAIVGSADHGWGSAHTLGWGGASIALLAGFWVLETRIANPIVPLGIFRSPGLLGAAITRGFVMVGVFAIFFFGPLYLQHVRGLSPLASGFAFLPMTLGIAAMTLGPVAKLVGRFGARRVLAGGVSVLTAGLVVFAFVGSHASYAPGVLAALLLAGIGGGSSLVPILTIAMADVPQRDAGLASGIMNASAQVASALGVAVLGTVGAHRTSALLADGHSAISAQMGGFHVAFALGAGAVAISLLVTLGVLRDPAPQPAAPPAPQRVGEPQAQPQRA